jgi:eukaryotic-like serine/threonine-protein kinase
MRSPTEACEGKILLGLDSCMAEQCAKPGAAAHPACVERRDVERRRREREESRSF